MKKFNIEEFEFSQSYLFFWDKVRHAGRVLGLNFKSYIYFNVTGQCSVC